MAGRSERVNADDLEDRIDGLIFEADEARLWLRRLEERSEQILRLVMKNKVFQTERLAAQEELAAIQVELADALGRFDTIPRSARVREGADAT